MMTEYIDEQIASLAVSKKLQGIIRALFDRLLEEADDEFYENYVCGCRED